MKIAVLTSDTPHHRFFLHKINSKYAIDSIFYETKSLKPKFDNTSPFKKQEENFEEENFFKEFPNSLLEIDSYFFESLNCQDSLAKFDSKKVDIGIVFGTGKLIPEVINKFSGHLMNIHRGIPQKYRGLDSDLWAIYKNDFDNIGTTLHLVEPDLDTGNIIGQDFLELNNTMRTHMIRYFTTLQATDLVLKALNDLSKGSLEHYPQESIGDYYSFMGKEDKIAVNQKFNSHCKQLP